MDAPSRMIIASDGVALAINESGPIGAPTVVCLHGYPDNSSVWDGVVAELATRHRVISYDVRGAGRSGRPEHRDGFRLDQLVADLGSVAEAVSPQRAVHLVGHDWGSIQGWHAVTGGRLGGKIASYTSISGPGLDHAANWMRSALRPGGAGARRVARQLLASSYLVLFNLPRLPEWLWRKGLLDRALAAKSPGDRVPARTLGDKINGLQLISTRPDVVARCVAELVEYAETGVQAPTLARARVIAKRPLAGKIAVVLGVGSETAWALAAQGADVIARDEVPDIVVNHVDGADDTVDTMRALGRQMIERGYAGRIVNVAAGATAKRVTTLLRAELGRDVGVTTVCARRTDSPARTARRVVAAIT